MTVYFIQSESTGAVKIGYSSQPYKRLLHLQATNASRLSLLRTIDGDVRTERWLHKRFDKNRLHWEWFSFDPEMMTIEPPTFQQKAALVISEIERGTQAPRDINDPLIRAYIGRAIQARIPKYGISDWYRETAKELSVTAEALGNWVRGKCCPSASNTLRLFAHFGPDFTNEVLEPAGQYCASITNLEAVKTTDRLPRTLEAVSQIQEIIHRHRTEYLDNVVDLKDTG